jgi:putative oxidoreductase
MAATANPEEFIIPSALSTNAAMLKRLLHTDAPGATLLIRLMVGAVFVSEGVQKFLFPEQLGVGRFTKIGLPMPDLLAPFVGAVEITCGTLVILGLATRLAAMPLLAVMTVALATTKWPILISQGFWAAAHEARTDWSMFLGVLFLLVVGAGRWSLDARVGSPSVAIGTDCGPMRLRPGPAIQRLCGAQGLSICSRFPEYRVIIDVPDWLPSGSTHRDRRPH